MALSKVTTSRQHCSNCGVEFETPIWGIVDALERPDLAADLTKTLAVSCPSCGSEIPHERPLIVTRWSPLVPILLVMGDDVPPETTGGDLHRQFVSLMTAVEDEGLEQVRPLRLSSAVLGRTTPEQLQADVQASMDEDFDWTGISDERRWLAQSVIGLLYERMAGDAVRLVLTVEDVSDMLSQLEPYPYQDPTFIRQMLDSVESFELFPDERSISALCAVIRALPQKDELPSKRAALVDSLRASVDRERLKELYDLSEDDAVGGHAAKVDSCLKGLRLARFAKDAQSEVSFTHRLASLRRAAWMSNEEMARDTLELVEHAEGSARSEGDLTAEGRMLGLASSILAESPLQADRANVERAIRMAESAIGLFLQDGDEELGALYMSNCARLLVRLNARSKYNRAILDRALDLVNRALEFRMRSGSRIDQAYSKSHRGLVLLKLAEGEQELNFANSAAEELSAALQLAKDSSDTDLVDHIKSLLADAYGYIVTYSEPNSDDAHLISERAESLIRELTDSDSATTEVKAVAWDLAARLKEHNGDPRIERIQALQKAYELTDRGRHPDLLRARAFRLGWLRIEEGDWGAAGDLLLVVFETHDVDEDPSGSAPVDDFSDPYQKLERWAAYCLARSNRARRAVEVLESGLCRFSGVWARTRHATLQEVERLDATLAEEFRSARGVLGETYGTELEGDSRAKLSAAQENIRGTGFPDFMRRAAYKDIALASSPTRPLVYLLSSPWGSVLLVLSGPDEEPSVVIVDEVTSSQLSELALAIEHPEGTPAPWKSVLLAQEAPDMREALDHALPILGEGLMGPLVESLATSVKEVTLVPTGFLSYFPIHAAPYRLNHSASTECLLDRMPVAYLPAAVFGSPSRSDVDHPVRHLVAIGDPATPGKKRLHGARVEASAAVSMFPGTTVAAYGPDATRGFLLENLKDGVSLHLACHASWLAGIGGAALHLADGDISTAELEATTRFSSLGTVVAAACGSARADIQRDLDEVFSLPTAFLSMGATGVISALWSISDEATALMLPEYYARRFARGEDPVAALRGAALWLRDLTRTDVQQLKQGTRGLSDWFRPAHGAKPFEHPYYWAALIYSGLAEVK
jgi:CHAT domain-containing protein